MDGLESVRLIVLAPFFAGLLLQATNARAEPAQFRPQIGDTYEIIMKQTSAQNSSDGSSGSSHDNDTIIERVIGVRPDGLELEYDLPKSASQASRTGTWQFPARVFKPEHGSMQLLNRPELEARIEAWLKAAKWTREVCGRWIFTWNAFRIECDPQSVIVNLESFDLRVQEALLHNSARA